MTILYRFSEDGFIPKSQAFHAEGAARLEASGCSRFGTYIPEWRDFVNGVFCFAGQLPNDDTLRILLNHLSRDERAKRQWWTAEISEESLVFDADALWRVDSLQPLKHYVTKGKLEFMIPEQTLKVSNVLPWGPSYKAIYPY